MTAAAGRGWFITLEGGEGVGKSTQVRLLRDRLATIGRSALVTREPGGSAKAEAIRTVLLSGNPAALGPAAEAILFTAARIDHLEQTIRPALRQGVDVVCDRFTDSTRAYQGMLGQVATPLIAALEAIAVGQTRPDLTLILDGPADVGLARAQARMAAQERPDRFERQERGYHDRLRAAFLAIAAAEPRRCVVIDAAQPLEAVAHAVWHAVHLRLFGGTEGVASP